ncbi:MAG TPA: hypothetical protein VF250_15375 [Conexibacter sp.]
MRILGAGALLPCARALAERNGAVGQRAVAGERGVRGLVAWMPERYGDPLPPAQTAGAPVALGSAAARVARER